MDDVHTLAGLAVAAHQNQDEEHEDGQCSDAHGHTHHHVVLAVRSGPKGPTSLVAIWRLDMEVTMHGHIEGHEVTLQVHG